ncbi:helix-turn-helix domain-containing protein [Streptomyces sp. NPDC002520]
MEQAAKLRELVSSREVPADIATRGRIVLWSAEGRRRKDIAELLGVSLPTVDRWKRRYAEHGLAGLEGDRPGGAREQVPARVRARAIALTRMTPPDGTGLSHWSTRELKRWRLRGGTDSDLVIRAVGVVRRSGFAPPADRVIRSEGHAMGTAP